MGSGSELVTIQNLWAGRLRHGWLDSIVYTIKFEIHVTKTNSKHPNWNIKEVPHESTNCD